MALVLNTFYGVRYCRWAELGKCTLTEYQAVENRPLLSAHPPDASVWLASPNLTTPGDGST